MLINCLLVLLAVNFLSAGVVPVSQNHIIGGRRIKIHEAPWQASVRHEGYHVCSGSIYSVRIIITAAHCLCSDNGIEYSTDQLSVSVGSSARSNGTVFGVYMKISHPNNTQDSSNNDLAVLRLTNSLALSDTVRPIALANKYPYPGTIATATGWGVTGYHSDLSVVVPEYLQSISLEVLSHEYCENFYEDPVPISSICAKPGICDGDSGGPLVVDRELVGVVSASNDYCDGPSVSTSMYYFKSWILQAINALNK